MYDRETTASLAVLPCEKCMTLWSDTISYVASCKNSCQEAVVTLPRCNLAIVSQGNSQTYLKQERQMMEESQRYFSATGILNAEASQRLMRGM